ncbi:MAG TPA: SH3 domain-containing protein, partial [Dehalococcoidia bacterium]|nr:SH3 domain-containing protein [Dehalococcoidia bacterium]
FGDLPVPLRLGPGGGDIVVPGLSGAITYTLSPGLSLPQSALAYRLRTPEVTPQRVQEIAARLGITGNVESVTAGPDGALMAYRVTSGLICPPNLPTPPPDVPKPGYDEKACVPERTFQMMLNGYITYHAGVSWPGSAVPSPEVAEAAVRQWLALSGLVNEGAYNLKVEEPRIDFAAYGLRNVVVEPKDSPSLVKGDHPMLGFMVNNEGSVYNASGNWTEVDATSDYPLHTAQELLTNLSNLRGEFSMLGTVEPQPYGALNRFQDASATVESVEVAYTLVGEQGGPAYLVPIFIVRGQLVQASGQTVPYTTWVPATGPTASKPETPPAIKDLLAVRSSLPLPVGGFLQYIDALPSYSSVGDYFGLRSRYFTMEEPEVVANFYREQLTALGWQPEEKFAGALGTPFAAPRELEESGRAFSFITDTWRVSVQVRTNLEVPSLGATMFHLEVSKRGPVAEITEDLNIRNLPTTKGQITGTLKKGERVELLEEFTGDEAEPGSGNQLWYRIAEGFIYSGYVSKP